MRGQILTLVLLGLLGSGSAQAQGDLDLFDKRPFAEAKRAAEDEQKWLIVNVTIKGNPRWAKSEALVWRDPAVMAWVKEHSIAVVVDANQELKLSGALNATQFSIIALKGAREVGRLSAYGSSAELLGWFDALERGMTPRQYEERRQQQQRELWAERQSRELRSLRLLAEEKYAEAAEDFAWLWQHVREHPRRISYMRQAAQESETARKLFRSLRDETAKRLENALVDQEDALDWVMLNEVLGDEGATLVWYKKAKDEARFQEVLPFVEFRLEPLFISHKMWRDIGRWLRPNPVEFLEIEFEGAARRANLGIGDEEDQAQLRAFTIDRFRTRNSAKYTGLLAAGREDEARVFVERLRQMDGSFDMLARLISDVLEAGEVRPAHVDWLRGVKGAMAADLRTKVEAALAGNKAPARPFR